MEESINNITNNIFRHISLSEQENIKQWEKDRDEFKEQLFIELNAIKDKEVRNAVIARLMKSSENANGKNFVNANGTVNIGKIKDSTKSIQIEVEKEIIAQREIEEKGKDTVKVFVMSEAEQAKQVERVKEEYKDMLPEGLSDEQKEAVYKKLAEMEAKANYYMGLLKRGFSQEEALQRAGVADEDLETFNNCLEKLKYEIERDALQSQSDKEQSEGIYNPETQERLSKAKQNVENAKNKSAESAAKSMFKLALQPEAETIQDSNSLKENYDSKLNQTAEGASLESEMNAKLSNETELQMPNEEASQSEVSNQTKDIILAVMDEGIESLEEFNEKTEEYLAGIEDETLRAEVGKSIIELTKLQKVGDSERSFRELLEAGELDESMIDSALESQVPKVEEPTINDSVTGVAFIEQSEPIAIDPKWEKMCQEAQERGEILNGPTLERLLSKYMEEEGLQQVEAPSTLGEIAGEENELSVMKPPAVESIEVEQVVVNMNPKEAHSLDENGEDREEDDEEKNSVERKEYTDKDGGNRRIALVTNDSNGEIANIQVFRSLISNVRMGEIEEVTNEIGLLANPERTTQKEEKQDVLE